MQLAIKNRILSSFFNITHEADATNQTKETPTSKTSLETQNEEITSCRCVGKREDLKRSLNIKVAQSESIYFFM